MRAQIQNSMFYDPCICGLTLETPHVSEVPEGFRGSL